MLEINGMPLGSSPGKMFDTEKVRKDFPLLERMINGKPIVYLDSAASSLKPLTVIEAVRNYYQGYSVNIHRGIYSLSEEATAAYEGARGAVADFISAKQNEIVFVRNATEAINLVMQTWGRQNLKVGDEIITTVMEHHANVVTWQELAKEKGLVVKYVQIDENGQLDQDNLNALLSDKTRLVVLTQVSNVLGTINPIKEIIGNVKCQMSNVKCLVDGAQGVPHMQVNVQDLGCDWYVFSGHKMLGPTGIGVLWGKEEILDEMPPYQFGGDMIEEVQLEGSRYKRAPYKFEAGTPDIAGAIGLVEAIKYLQKLGMKAVREHEMGVTAYALKALQSVKGLKIIGPKDFRKRGGVMAFTVDGVHPHDLAQILDEDNVCIRAGHHCAMPLHICLGLMATARASFYVYTTTDEIEKLVEGVEKAIIRFKK